MNDFVQLVREKFAFLERSRERSEREVMGFFEYLADPGADWESYCGYWTVLFVLTFTWDRRASLLMLSLRRNYSIFCPCYKDADVVSVDAMIRMVQPEWRDPGMHGATTLQHVARLLDVYADALERHCVPILLPPPDKRFHHYEAAKLLGALDE